MLERADPGHLIAMPAWIIAVFPPMLYAVPAPPSIPDQTRTVAYDWIFWWHFSRYTACLCIAWIFERLMFIVVSAPTRF